MRIISRISNKISKRNNLKKVRKIVDNQKNIKLEIGAFNKKGTNGWVTLDQTENCDICWNLNDGLPFPDNTVSKIYSSHVFEHFNVHEIRRLLKECLRALKPEGVFSICVPNAEFYFKAYSNNTKLEAIGGDIYASAFFNTTKIDYLNYVAYMNGDHKHMFDTEHLFHLLEEAGFKKPQTRNFDPNLDKKVREFESIHAMAIK